MAERKSIADRFWSKVDKLSSPYGCWLWTAGLFRGGYGEFWTGSKMARANRISWEMHNGTVPDGLHVLHSCDQHYSKGDIEYRRCVRPDHLWVGTHDDNMRDRGLKGRSSGGSLKGEHGPGAKLSESQAKAILSLDGTYRSIAGRYGVSKSLVGAIKNRIVWTHI